MMWTAQRTQSWTVKHLVEQILAQGKMSRQEHLQLTSAILSDCKITDEERRQVNRIFDYVQTGRLQLVD